MNPIIILGTKVRCTLTGITGTTVARTEYFNSVPRVGIQPFGADRDGKAHELFWQDESAVVPAEMQPA